MLSSVRSCECGHNTILYIAHSNGYPYSTIRWVNKEIICELQNKSVSYLDAQQPQKWVIFNFLNSLIRKVTSIFKYTNLCIPF